MFHAGRPRGPSILVLHLVFGWCLLTAALPGSTIFGIAWSLGLIAFFYGLTRSVRQRSLLFVALIATQMLGFRTPVGYLTPVQLLASILVAEYLLRAAVSRRGGHLPRFVRTQSLIGVMLIGQAAASIGLSPIVAPSMMPWIRFSTLVAAYLVVLAVLGSEQSPGPLMKALGLQLYFFLLVVLYQNYLFPPPLESRVEAWFDYGGRLRISNVLVCYMAGSVPCLLAFWDYRKPLIFGSIAIFSLLGLYLSRSRMGFVILAADLLLCGRYLAARRRFVQALALILLLAAVAPLVLSAVGKRRAQDPMEQSGLRRWYAAVSHVQTFLAYPMTGVGFGMWARKHELGLGQMIDIAQLPNGEIASMNAHNLLLRVAADMGLPGVVLLVAFWAHAAWICFGRKRKPWGQYDRDGLVSRVLFVNLLLLSTFGDYLENGFFWTCAVGMLLIAQIGREGETPGGPAGSGSVLPSFEARGGVEARGN